MARPPVEKRGDSIEDEAKQLPATCDPDSLSSASSHSPEGAVPAAVRPDEAAVAAQNVGGDEIAGAATTSSTTKSAFPQEADTTMASAGPPAPGQHQSRAIAPEDQRTKLQTALIILALCSAVLLAALDVTITTVAIPTICAEFQSSSGYTWIGSAYLLANAATAPSWGKLSDIFGRKPVLLGAVGTFWIGSLLCGVSVHMDMLIFGRVVQGIGGGGSLILVNICISDLFSVRRRGVYLGYVGLVWALAGGFGPVLGGVFTSKATWRWCFYINLPVSGLAFAVLYFTLQLHNPKTPIKQGLKALDWLGSLTMVGGTLMFLLGLEMAGNVFPWKSPQIICLLVFGVFVAGLCILVELYVATSPIIPIRLFNNVKNIAVLGLCACHGFVFISVSYFMPLYFQGVLGASALLSGVYVLPFTFMQGICSAGAGFFIKKTGMYKPPIVAGFALTLLGYGLFLDLDPYANWPKIILFQIVLGLGVGPNFQSPLIALQSTVQPRDIASATGTFMFVRQLSTSVSIVAGGVLFDSAIGRRAVALAADGELSADVAALLTGGRAAASVARVAALPAAAAAQRAAAQGAYFGALRAPLFVFYVAVAALGLLGSAFVGGQALSSLHTEHRTGLATMAAARPRAGDEGEAAAEAASVEEAGPSDAEKAAEQARASVGYGRSGNESVR